MKLNPEIEAVLHPKNIDEDCNYIATLLEPFSHQINADLDKGNYAPAVELYLQLLTSIAKHFIEDEHYCYFDDFYAPDYLCLDLLRRFESLHRNGVFPKEIIERLKEGLEELMQMEAVWNYGCLGDAEYFLREL